MKTNKLYRVLVTIALAVMILTACNPGDMGDIMTKSNPVSDGTTSLLCQFNDGNWDNTCK